MKILWITNSLAFPDVCMSLGIPEPQLGGWMKSMLGALRETRPKWQFGIATLYLGTKHLLKKEINGVTYYCIPGSPAIEYKSGVEDYWKKIRADFAPDVVHIHGTEFAHGLAYLRVCGGESVCVSLQGVMSGIERYCLGGITMETLKKYRTLYDFLKTSVVTMRSTMPVRIDMEKEYFMRCKHIIGRTEWDRTHLWAINPGAAYYFCNENLRDSFYDARRWQYGLCDKHRIFLSQAASPLKGLQKVIEALPIVLVHYPDTEVYVAGQDYTRRRTLKEKLKFRAFPNYICHLMQRFGLQGKIHFTGFLDAEGMKEQYLKANVFVCPSSVENSPNSLGEAQMVGTPCVAAASGGIPSMVVHGKTGLLYRFEEHEMMARYICDIFDNCFLADSLSANEQEEAQKRHDKVSNAMRMIEIYNEILKS